MKLEKKPLMFYIALYYDGNGTWYSTAEFQTRREARKHLRAYEYEPRGGVWFKRDHKAYIVPINPLQRNGCL